MHHETHRRAKKLCVRTTALSTIAAAALAALAGPASAATQVSKSGEQLIVAAAAGKANDVFIRRSPNEQFFLIRDRGDTVTPGPGCQAAGTEVQCSAIGTNRPEQIVVNAGDGNDRVVANGKLASTVNGQAGNDILRAGFAGANRNTLTGGTGDDRLFAGSGDVLRGNAGNDLLVGSKFTDFLNGGAGDDNLRGGDGNDELRGDAGNDRLDGGAGIDDLCIGETEINCEADV
jgi:Ca2+-binding RTX toxin-like protein